jgi:hypothetical protein
MFGPAFRQNFDNISPGIIMNRRCDIGATRRGGETWGETWGEAWGRGERGWQIDGDGGRIVKGSRR